MTCQEARLSLGVYVLGALDDTERGGLEAHLRRCAGCTAEHAELATLPALLAPLTLDEAQGSSPTSAPAPAGYQALVARASEDVGHRRRAASGRARRWLAASAVVLVLAGTGVGVASWQAGRPATGSYAASVGPVNMRVAVTSQTRGTGLDVTVTGLPAGESCRLVAVSADGSRQVAVSWQATYAGQARVKGGTSIPESQLAQLVLLGTEGQQLVAIRI